MKTLSGSTSSGSLIQDTNNNNYKAIMDAERWRRVDRLLFDRVVYPYSYSIRNNTIVFITNGMAVKYQISPWKFLQVNGSISLSTLAMTYDDTYIYGINSNLYLYKVHKDTLATTVGAVNTGSSKGMVNNTNHIIVDSGTSRTLKGLLKTTLALSWESTALTTTGNTIKPIYADDNYVVIYDSSYNGIKKIVINPATYAIDESRSGSQYQPTDGDYAIKIGNYLYLLSSIGIAKLDYSTFNESKFYTISDSYTIRTSINTDTSHRLTSNGVDELYVTSSTNGFYAYIMIFDLNLNLIDEVWVENGDESDNSHMYAIKSPDNTFYMASTAHLDVFKKISKIQGYKKV